MKIQIETSSYNPRRYGKPWIARVDFSTSPQGDFHWGDWIGDVRNGSVGVLIISASEGDIIAMGQKDFRKPANSAPNWYQVRDGKLITLASKARAYQLACAVVNPAP
jgi:hypothetical protein